VTRWWSANPDKAWVERFVLLYTPAWILAVAAVMLGGWVHDFGDRGFLGFSMAVAAPAVVGPALLHRRFGDGRPWWRAYWVKLNVWSAILVAGGTYFGTHYFFDLMGMQYGFDVTWTFESPVVGRSAGTVPAFMYPLTHAYFMSYFVGMVVVYRWARTRFGLGPLARGAVVLALAYAIAFAETFTMANPLMADAFAYADRERMLMFGSLGYAVYFVVGLPMLYRIDEPAPGDPRPDWPLRRVALHALAAYMLVLCGLELWAQLVGPL
jgi:cycloeucalenol cycloisomerase